MNTTHLAQTTAARLAAGALRLTLNKVMTRLVLGLGALDKKLSQRPGRIRSEAAAMLRLAEVYAGSQPSYAADLRAAAMTARDEISDRS